MAHYREIADAERQRRDDVRGFACLGLYRPKTPENVGGAIRAAYAYGVAQVNIEGARRDALNHKSNTPKGHRHTPTFFVDSVTQYTPHDTKVVVVEICEGAQSLFDFTHPERAMYVFGPEDGSVSDDVTKSADHVVYIPTRCCMNLASSINVVLYDRAAKRGRFDHPYSSPKVQSYNRRKGGISNEGA